MEKKPIQFFGLIPVALIIFIFLAAGVYVYFLRPFQESQNQTPVAALNASLERASSEAPSEAYFYVPGGDKLPDCPKWCYIDLTSAVSHFFVVPPGTSDLAKYNLLEKWKENNRIANSKTLTKACMYIRFASDADLAHTNFIELSNSPGSLAGYSVVPSILGPAGDKDILVTDRQLYLNTLMTKVNLATASEISGAGLLQFDSGQYNTVQNSTADTLPVAYGGKTQFMTTQPVADQKINGAANYGSRINAHEIAAHILPITLLNPNGAIDPATGKLKQKAGDDEHHTDSKGVPFLPSHPDNIALSGDQASTNGYGLTDQQISDFKDLCNSAGYSNQDHSAPDKSEYKGSEGCGDGICGVGETSGWCPEDCGKDKDPSKNGCQWIAGKQDNSDGSKMCGGTCQDPRMVCNMGGSTGTDCGCRLCGNGVKDPGEECEKAADCPVRPGMTATCAGCKCLYKSNPK